MLVEIVGEHGSHTPPVGAEGRTLCSSTLKPYLKAFSQPVDEIPLLVALQASIDSASMVGRKSLNHMGYLEKQRIQVPFFHVSLNRPIAQQGPEYTGKPPKVHPESKKRFYLRRHCKRGGGKLEVDIKQLHGLKF